MVSDRQKMIAFISSQLPAGEGAVQLGGNSEGVIVAHVSVVGDNLELSSNLPDWVAMREIYEQLRWNSMTSWEQGNMMAHPSRQQAFVSSRSLERVAVGSPKVQQPSERMGRILADLPEEVSTEEAAQILGQSKDTVLKLRASGLLDFRNAAPPGSTRPAYRYTLESVLRLRKSYDTEEPTPDFPQMPHRRKVMGKRQYKYIDYD